MLFLKSFADFGGLFLTGRFLFLFIRLRCCLQFLFLLLFFIRHRNKTLPFKLHANMQATKKNSSRSHHSARGGAKVLDSSCDIFYQIWEARDRCCVFKVLMALSYYCLSTNCSSNVANAWVIIRITLPISIGLRKG